MRRARVGFVTFGLVSALVACVGGPGSLPDQGIDQASQGGGIIGGGSTNEGNSGSGSSTGSGNSGSGTRPPSRTEPSLPTTIFVTGYDRDCKEDSDCVLVFQGAVCTACKCPNGAINESDQSKYQSDLSDRSADCPDQGDVACAPCQSVPARCEPATGKCSQGPIVPDAG